MQRAIKFKIVFEIEFDFKENHKIVESFKVWPSVTIKGRAGHSPDLMPFFLLLFRFWYIKRIRMEDRDVTFLVQNFQ